MPIQVYVEVNGQPVETLHIGRVRGDTDPDTVNTYSAVVKTSPPLTRIDGSRYTVDYPTNREWDNGTMFEHRYGDGINACVAKAFNALDKSD